MLHALTVLWNFLTKYPFSLSFLSFRAALKAVGESVQKPLSYYENNVGGTCNLLEASRSFLVFLNMLKFLLLSTRNTVPCVGKIPVIIIFYDAKDIILN